MNGASRSLRSDPAHFQLLSSSRTFSNAILHTACAMPPAEMDKAEGAHRGGLPSLASVRPRSGGPGPLQAGAGVTRLRAVSVRRSREKQKQLLQLFASHAGTTHCPSAPTSPATATATTSPRLPAFHPVWLGTSQPLDVTEGRAGQQVCRTCSSKA